MAIVFLGSEALDRNEVTEGQLRWNYRAIYPNVYAPRIAAPSLYHNTVGAWLWSGRRAPITGRAASAIHGAKWVDENAPVELLWRNNRPPKGGHHPERPLRLRRRDRDRRDGSRYATASRVGPGAVPSA